MGKAIYFRNVRRDGEVHTGLSLDDELVLENWRNQSQEPDPVLDWFVEIEIEDPDIPQSPDQLRAWLLDRSTEIDQALRQAARELDVGVDGGVVPFRVRTTVDDSARTIEVRGAESQRVRSTAAAAHIEETRADWRDDLAAMATADLQAI